MIAQTALIIIVLLILAALALDVRATLRNSRWQERRGRILTERLGRCDQAYGDELTIARVMMRPSFPAPRNVHPLSDRLGVHSVRVKP